jgi:hypothetical protein
MTQSPDSAKGNESRRGARSVDVPQFKVKRLRHAGIGPVELTYAPLRPRGVADDLAVVVYS